ncbi:metalloprotease [Exidia glandulosa HHB12029]|uniref:Metalloprotease n=1 Tax=Exidia glandulosa HHB12029 TaxID=1314781 RepID=A0A165MXP2_EXIGL|nr:metalloprotease [Exidia glandulosa HHB12029]
MVHVHVPVFAFLTFLAPHGVTALQRGCGTETASAERVASLEADSAPVTSNTTKTKYFSSTIPVHWHVIRANETYQGGSIPENMIQEQMQTINRVPSDSFLSLVPDSGSEQSMKQTYRKGDVNALNIYTVGFLDGAARWLGIYGYSTWPWDYASVSWNDGVVIKWSTLPGGTEEGFNLGKTATHEIGHWVGLYHTFEGGCESPGDYVFDTTPEDTGAEGCPVGRKTCNGTIGYDPIHNYMDYSTDECMTGFTAGQIVRMRTQLFKYRNVLF